MKKIAMGILAHVDAGKTTLSEAVLYQAGGLRKMGRVDHGNTFLDNFALEKSRGITIFSKQAVFPLGEKEITLLDTPGHVDFSAEMERCLWVMDYAVLVVSGADGIQAHTETLWNLLKEYRIPTFIFVNKMDQEGADREARLAELQNNFGDGCIAFTQGNDREEMLEAIAMEEEEVLEEYMDTGTIRQEEIRRLIRERKIFPCFFGSALKLTGVEELLAGMETYMEAPQYPEAFGAKIYKISRDEQGNRLTHLKITGGKLKVKTPFANGDKVDQIRRYSGAKYQTLAQAEPGEVCAVTGLTDTRAGQGLGKEKDLTEPLLEPVMTCRMFLPEGVDAAAVMDKLMQLEEEDPLLHLLWNSHLQEMHVQLMGEVQTEILKSMIEERFGLSVEFGPGRILYKETIEKPAAGVGHYEPLRHYAEVHLMLEPGEPGSGLVFSSACSEDELDGNWQRLILTHLKEKEHPGVLAGMPITDMKITLTAGKAHKKHTEGGDFRQATYRAVRQGLMSASSVLLEPWYAFRLEIPAEQLGRGMTDIQKMSGSFASPQMEGEKAILRGRAPVSEMMNYQREVQTYTGGRGKLFLHVEGYEPCHNADAVVPEIGYDCEKDTENPAGSIFCSHGAGYYVPWQEVPEHMHIKDIPYEKKALGLSGGQEKAEERNNRPKTGENRGGSGWAEDKELEEIFLREFGRSKKQEDRRWRYGKTMTAQSKAGATRTGKGIPEKEAVQKQREYRKQPEKQYLLVDGYNIIFAWDFLKDLAQVNLEAARNKLMDILCNYQGFTQKTVILVFDAYRVKGNPGEIFRYHNIHVVYTREAETADQYIEKTTHELGRRYQVTVATSDALEQVIVMGQGARRLSATDFLEEIRWTEEEIRRVKEEKRQNGKNYLFHHMDGDTAELLEDVRLGKASFEES